MYNIQYTCTLFIHRHTLLSRIIQYEIYTVMNLRCCELNLRWSSNSNFVKNINVYMTIFLQGVWRKTTKVKSLSFLYVSEKYKVKFMILCLLQKFSYQVIILLRDYNWQKGLLLYERERGGFYIVALEGIWESGNAVIQSLIGLTFLPFTFTNIMQINDKLIEILEILLES